MSVKTKCPSCEAEIELPDDPRMGALVEQVQQQTQLITKLSEKLEKAGQPVPPEVKPVLKEGKKTKKRYEGVFFEDDAEVEEDDDGEAERK